MSDREIQVGDSVHVEHVGRGLVQEVQPEYRGWPARYAIDTLDGERIYRDASELQLIEDREFEVTLEMRMNGSACGSTYDVISAATPDQAIEKAKAEWINVRPQFTYHELATMEVAAHRGAV